MQNHRHFILHKPIGYLSQFVFNQTKRKNKKLLGDLYDFPDDVMAIGRLDKNSEGLLLLTTDGAVSEKIRSKRVEKEYYVEIDGTIDSDAIASLSSGVEISIYGKPYTTLPSKVSIIDFTELDTLSISYGIEPRHRETSWVSITITEGKFRQIRKMTAAVGFPTLRLIRVRVGKILLGELACGVVVEEDSLHY